MLLKALKYLIPSTLCLSLAGCYINAYPPAQQIQPVYATGGVIPPNYVPPSMNVKPQHATGGVIPPNYVPPSMNVKPQHATGFRPPFVKVDPQAEKIQQNPKVLKKNNSDDNN